MFQLLSTGQKNSLKHTFVRPHGSSPGLDQLSGENVFEHFLWFPKMYSTRNNLNFVRPAMKNLQPNHTWMVKTNKTECFPHEIKEMARRLILASAVTQEKKLQAYRLERASLVAQTVKNLPLIQETQIQSLGWGRSPGGKNGNPLQYSCLENSTDREAWQAIVHGVTKNWKRLRD